MQINDFNFSDSTNSQSVKELALSGGLACLTDEQLVMLILGKGQEGGTGETLASKVTDLIDTGSFDQLLPKLSALDGVGKDGALVLTASLELGRRKSAIYRAQIRFPRDVIPFLKHFALKPVEHFIVVSVNGAMEILSMKVIAVGTIDNATILPRDVFSDAVALHASGIICCHNHPSSDCYPSKQDRHTTQQLQKAASLLAISFLDHIIITKDADFSFLDHGLLNSPYINDES